MKIQIFNQISLAYEVQKLPNQKKTKQLTDDNTKREYLESGKLISKSNVIFVDR